MSLIQPPGGGAPDLDIPGIRGTIRIRYDLSTGLVDLKVKNIAYPHLAYVLISALQGAVNEWEQADRRIVRGKPEGATDGTEETSDSKNDDDNG